MLVEGGELGREHPTVRTRRLPSPHRPESPAQPVSQIDEELLFHIADGGLALDPASDFKFKIEQETQPDGSVKDVHKLDLPTPPVGTFPTVPKLRIGNSVAGGVRIMHILQFAPGRSPAGYDISGLADTHSLNPRLVVGTVRLCRALAALGVRTMITVGFNRRGDTKFHGPGRGIDFSGAIMAHVIPLKDPNHPTVTDLTDPHVTTKLKPPWKNVTAGGATVTAFERDCVAEVDFIVEFHWGGVQLLVATGAPAGIVRRNEDGRLYQNPRAPTQPEKLLYRMSILPGAPPERSARHALTDAHYTLAGTVFRAAYQFFAREFSHRDALLGPLAGRRAPPGAAAAAAFAGVLSDAALDDANGSGAAPTEPGAIDGFVLHPDIRSQTLLLAAALEAPVVKPTATTSTPTWETGSDRRTPSHEKARPSSAAGERCVWDASVGIAASTGRFGLAYGCCCAFGGAGHAFCRRPASEETVCGNAKVDEGESCDDGNTQGGDGCSDGCRREPARFVPWDYVLLADGSVVSRKTGEAVDGRPVVSAPEGTLLQTNKGFRYFLERFRAPPLLVPLPSDAGIVMLGGGCLLNDRGEVVPGRRIRFRRATSVRARCARDGRWPDLDMEQTATRTGTRRRARREPRRRLHPARWRKDDAMLGAGTCAPRVLPFSKDAARSRSHGEATGRRNRALLRALARRGGRVLGRFELWPNRLHGGDRRWRPAGVTGTRAKAPDAAHHLLEVQLARQTAGRQRLY